MSDRRNNVRKRSNVGKPLNSEGVRTYRITSSVSNDSAMLTLSKQSNIGGATGRISNITVPNNPAISHRSPWRSSSRKLVLSRAMIRQWFSGDAAVHAWA